MSSLERRIYREMYLRYIRNEKNWLRIALSMYCPCLSVSQPLNLGLADAISCGCEAEAWEGENQADKGGMVGNMGNGGRQLTVVIADGNSVFRSGVVALLARETDVRAVPATSTEMLLGLLAELTPAVVLVDVDLPPRRRDRRDRADQAAGTGSSDGGDRRNSRSRARTRDRACRRARHHRAQRALRRVSPGSCGVRRLAR